MKNTLKLYIRDENRNPHGVVVFIKTEKDQCDLYGYSLCSPKDKFDKKLGTAIALARATNKELKPETFYVPFVSDRRDLVLQAYSILERTSKKYFKNENN